MVVGFVRLESGTPTLEEKRAVFAYRAGPTRNGPDLSQETRSVAFRSVAWRLLAAGRRRLAVDLSLDRAALRERGRRRIPALEDVQKEA